MRIKHLTYRNVIWSISILLGHSVSFANLASSRIIHPKIGIVPSFHRGIWYQPNGRKQRCEEETYHKFQTAKLKFKKEKEETERLKAQEAAERLRKEKELEEQKQKQLKKEEEEKDEEGGEGGVE